MSKENSSPLVSVIIPCFNAEKYIDKCILSVLEQDYENIEIIIIDDGSTDGSLEIIKKYNNVNILTQSNSGACVARNAGLKISRGKYVKFLDSDDVLLCGILKRQVNLAELSSDNDIIYGDYIVNKGNKKKYVCTNIGNNNQTALLFLNDILTTTPLHQRWMLIKVNGFDERLKNGQEWNLHIRLSSEGFYFKYDNFASFEYNIHDSESRISVNSFYNKSKLEYSLIKLDIIKNRMGGKSSGNVDAAMSHCYWNIARAFYRDSDWNNCIKCQIKAKEFSKQYKLFWPCYYKVLHLFLGFKVTENLLKLFYLIKKNNFL